MESGRRQRGVGKASGGVREPAQSHPRRFDFVLKPNSDKRGDAENAEWRREERPSRSERPLTLLRESLRPPQSFLPTSSPAEKIFSQGFSAGSSFLGQTFPCLNRLLARLRREIGRGMDGSGIGCGFAARCFRGFGCWRGENIPRRFPSRFLCGLCVSVSNGLRISRFAIFQGLLPVRERHTPVRDSHSSQLVDLG
jgi:hypothetical protein